MRASWRGSNRMRLPFEAWPPSGHYLQLEAKHSIAPAAFAGALNNDLSRLLQALIDGRILTPGTLKKMISPESSGAVFDDGERYGYGWALPPAGQPVTVFAHRGDKDGFRTIAFVDTRHRLDYVILCNGGDAGVAVMNHLRALFEHLLQPPPA